MTTNSPPRIEKLSGDHYVDGFESGQPSLDLFFHRYALQSQQSGGSTTYLGMVEQTIIGFYTLVFGDVSYADAPERLSRGLSQQPVPLMVLARLGVDLAWQGRGIGSALLRDAMKRTLQASEIAGLRALAVHAKDETAASFYSHFGFVASPTDPLHLFLLMKDLRRMLPNKPS